jgi:putative membrane protein
VTSDPAIDQALHTWTWDPLALGVVAVVANLYAMGAVRLWQRGGPSGPIRLPQIAAYGSGLLVVLAALVSPLDALSEELFSAHMSQHELLMLVAAPLVVMGKPLLAFLWALPRRPREAIGSWVARSGVRACWRAVTAPVPAFCAHGLVLWVWHAPALFEAALASEAVHAVQHLSFFVTSALFSWSLLHGRYGRAGYGAGAALVFATATHTGVLGALIASASRTWYPTYAAHPAAGALQDQQLAGIIMWIPGGALLTAAALALFSAWLGEADRRARTARPT